MVLFEGSERGHGFFEGSDPAPKEPSVLKIGN